MNVSNNSDFDINFIEENKNDYIIEKNPFLIKLPSISLDTTNNKKNRHSFSSKS